MEDVMTIFNSPIEFAMRALMILDKTNVAMTARKLSLIDYMVTHIHDFNKKAESVHADSPFRSGEWISRTGTFDAGLRILVSRSLITIHHQEDGIYFSTTELSRPFLNYIESEYKSDYYMALDRIRKSVFVLPEERIYSSLKKRVREWEIGVVSL
jgi:hypothetical protein